MSEQYKNAGVNLEAGYESVERIKKHIEKTKVLGSMNLFGSFGGMFDLSKYNYKEPVLVSGTDGVGTKLMLAFMMDKHDTVGQDLVAMCVNDIITQGADPLLFLDYIAVGKNEPIKIEQIVKGVSDACILSGCELIGGETAEMPDMYSEGHYDLAGFVVGCTDKSDIITGENITPGQVIIGLPSSGVHSNGFSLVRKICFKDNDFKVDDYFEELGMTLGECLLTPTEIYVESIKKIKEKISIKGMSHITGGGFYENIPRVLPSGVGVNIYKDQFDRLPIFDFLMKHGQVEEVEMYNVFNMGIGMMVIIDSEDLEETTTLLDSEDIKYFIIGETTSEEGVNII